MKLFGALCFVAFIVACMPMLSFGFDGPHGDIHVQPHFNVHPDVRPIVQPPHDGWHGNDWHGGGWQQPVINPWNYIVPVINGIATAPRLIVNPNTGLAQWMTPGSWALVNVGTPLQSYVWVPSPTGTWLTTGAKTAGIEGGVWHSIASAAKPVVFPHPIRNFIKRRPIRRLIFGK